MAKILEKTKEMVKPVIEFEEAVFEKVRNMVVARRLLQSACSFISFLVIC